MRVVQLTVPVADGELAADRLWVAGARAVEEVHGGDGTVGLRTVLAEDDTTSRERLGPLADGWVLEWVDVPDEASNAWRDHAVAIDVDGAVLRPAWLPEIGDGRLELAIEPGAAFGLGDHPTTRLSAAAALRLTTPGCRVLDVGSGSGVLGILAARVGAGRVVAIDIAEAAVEATAANAVRNGVVIEVSSMPLGDVDGSFDLVLANVLAPAIIAMSDDLRRVLAPRGTLVVSGILADAHEHVVDALRPLRVERTDVLDGWAAVELRR